MFLASSTWQQPTKTELNGIDIKGQLQVQHPAKCQPIHLAFLWRVPIILHSTLYSEFSCFTADRCKMTWDANMSESVPYTNGGSVLISRVRPFVTFNECLCLNRIDEQQNRLQIAVVKDGWFYKLITTSKATSFHPASGKRRL